MLYLKGYLARPLDEAFSAASRVAVLRVLSAAAEPGRGGREVARLAGINHQSAAQALRALEKIGVVESRRWGRKTYWRLDRNRWLVSELIVPIMKGEARYAEQMVSLIKSRLKGKCRAAMIVGPAAQGRMLPGQALPLLAVSPSVSRGLGDALRDLRSEFSRQWGIELQSHIVTVAQAVKIAAVEDAWRLLPDEGSGFVTPS